MEEIRQWEVKKERYAIHLGENEFFAYIQRYVPYEISLHTTKSLSNAYLFDEEDLDGFESDHRCARYKGEYLKNARHLAQILGGTIIHVKVVEETKITVVTDKL